MPLQATSGAASYDAFGGGVAAIPTYIEDVFSTWLFTGNGSSQTIVNNIDLATKGGLVWQKIRGPSAGAHILTDTARGVGNYIMTQSADPQYSGSGAQAFNTNGFGSTPYGSATNIASWTFRKQPKFFDVVTYTGNGSTNRTISHNLQSTPGCVIIKRTDTTSDWIVWHTSMGNFGALDLNQNYSQGAWLSTGAGISSTTMQVGGGSGPAPGGSGYLDSNTSGGTYVAYLFAHNAGGFGLTGTDNVISCGSFTTDSSTVSSVNLGYEPQFVIYKKSSDTGNWVIRDVMRNWPVDVGGTTLRGYLAANSSNSETDFAGNNGLALTSNGFKSSEGSELSADSTYIYIAIRRGPMKVPTDATKVFKPVLRTGTGDTTAITGFGFPPDMRISHYRSGAPSSQYGEFVDKLRGPANFLKSNTTDTETTTALTSFDMDGITTGGFGLNAGGTPYADWNFRRAPSFFDEVCYRGTGSATTVAHNLGVAPELILFKARGGGTADWRVYVSPSTNLLLNTTDSIQTDTVMWNNTAPTSTVFSLGPSRADVNESARNYVSYLFATCSGVSKVGSYTGNGTTQTINCGFTGGARFVLIKRTDSTGDWYVYDTARGMTVLTDPYLFLNNTNAEVATLGSVTTVSTGFALNSTILAAINVSGGTYIFLAIA